MRATVLRRIGLAALLALYLGLACWQLGLPGLHYDEAAEAGVNAMELLTSSPGERPHLTAFRNATFDFLGWPLPLMVQDYIGALNVYLALPLLALTGIGVPNLRILAVLTGLVALLLLERAVTEWQIWHAEWSDTPRCVGASAARTPLSLASLIAVALLAASPSFIFWSRQGVFVTNLTQPLCFWALWQGVRWLRTGRPSALLWSAFAGGLAIYAKVLAFWVIMPLVMLAGGWWLGQRRQGAKQAASLSTPLLLGVIVAFCLPLVPLLLFNWQTGGTLARVEGSLGQSYYGVDNGALLQNALIRSRQLVQAFRGDHLWYLGGLYANNLAPWLAGILVLLGLWRDWRRVAPPLALFLLAMLCSLFTVSDLFITHYALLHPLAVVTVAISLTSLATRPQTDKVLMQPATLLAYRAAFLLILLVWLTLDLNATLRYHVVLERSGGLADHSDASYHLAYYLRYGGLGAPIALDWGFAAPVRYLSEGKVQPIELFGYESMAAPDAGFGARLKPFLENADNVYLLHAPGATVFAGRREELERQVSALGRRLVLEQTFTQRDGTPIYELWRVTTDG